MGNSSHVRLGSSRGALGVSMAGAFRVSAPEMIMRPQRNRRPTSWSPQIRSAAPRTTSGKKGQEMIGHLVSTGMRFGPFGARRAVKIRKGARTGAVLIMQAVWVGLLLALPIGCSKGESSSPRGSHVRARTRPSATSTRALEPEIGPGVRATKDPRWHKVTIKLPDGAGSVTFMRLPRYDFLARYERKVMLRSSLGTAVFDLPPNKGRRTKVDVYLVRTETGPQVWMHDSADRERVYVFRMDTLSFRIFPVGKYRARSLTTYPVGPPFVTISLC